jgi:hypothetical protein
MEKTELLAIMAAVIYSAESTSDQKANIKSAVEKAVEIFKEVKEVEHHLHITPPQSTSR